ncbi:hypothetical protein [Cyclobacterium xiamenense]|uniref:hypothetical protein n=1 Tax=Cyclobacterium xiamenense TaxID=1297121 RepID=UPI0035D07D4D
MNMPFQNFDAQLFQFRDKLETIVKIPSGNVDCVASKIANEIENNKGVLRDKIMLASPIPLETRLEELNSFQTMMDTFNNLKPLPEIIRTQVITQNYICFVYLKDTLFDVLRKNSEKGSVTKICTNFLLENPVRSFRNAIAHGNWKFNQDYTGIEFWARKGGNSGDPLTKFLVLQSELGFWQMLARAVAYTAYLKLTGK